MYTPSPNANFDHGFAIVRLQVDWPKETPINPHIATVKKIVWSMEEAEKEVERLNHLNHGKGYEYYWEITRLERVASVPRPSADVSTEIPSPKDECPAIVDAVGLFEDSMRWLEAHYDEFSFNLERDLVWTVQSHLRAKIRERGLDYSVYNDFPMLPRKRRALSADLVIREPDGQVAIAVEFKYEPDHRRKDLLPNKLPVVGWVDPLHDCQRIFTFIAEGKARVAYAIFIDEGGHFRGRPSPEGSTWIDWKIASPEGDRVSVLWTRLSTPPDGGRPEISESTRVAQEI